MQEPRQHPAKLVFETKSFFRLHVIKLCNFMPQDAPWAQKTHEELPAVGQPGEVSVTALPLFFSLGASSGPQLETRVAHKYLV